MPINRKRLHSDISAFDICPALDEYEPSAVGASVAETAEPSACMPASIAKGSCLSADRSHVGHHLIPEKSSGEVHAFQCSKATLSHHHSCKRFTELEFDKLKATSHTMQQFEKEWGAVPAYLTHICGINFDYSYCELDVSKTDPMKELMDRSFTHSASLSKSSHFINRFLVPIGMPFTVRENRVFGSVYLTPFYTVIPQLIRKIPPVIFSLHRLTLSRVVTNKVVRHELAFNSKLQIEAPLGMVEATTSSGVWGQLAHEISSLALDHIVSVPITVAPQVLSGLSSLMISVFPGCFYERIAFYLDASRIINGNFESRTQILDEMARFIVSMLDTCVLPMRRKWVKVIEKLLSQRRFNSGHFVNGLKTATALLNLTKLDHINAQLRDRVPLLLESTTGMEKQFYEREVQTGRLNCLEFQNWLKSQSTIISIISCYPQLVPISVLRKCFGVPTEIEHFVGQLTSGFLTSYLRDSSERLHGRDLFPLDKSRIAKLQARVELTVLECTQDGLYRVQCEKHDRNKVLQLIGSSKLRYSPVYAIYKRRILASMALKIYRVLVSRITGRQLEIMELNLFQQAEATIFAIENLVSEIGKVLYLHWMGASQFYLS